MFHTFRNYQDAAFRFFHYSQVANEFRFRNINHVLFNMATGSGHDEVNLAGFQPDFILYLQNADYFIQIFIEPKGRNIEDEQWKEDLLTYINEHEAEIVFEDQTDDVKIKGVKFYTMNDGRGTIRQLGEIALGRPFKGLSVDER